MRRVIFRGPDKTDWGLPKFGNRDIWYNLKISISQAVHHMFVQQAEARKIRRHLRKSRGPIQIALGSGRKVEHGWIGLDFKKGEKVFRCDLRKPLPFADASVDALLAEHIIEHLPLDDIPHLLAECRRILKPGRPIRIVSPDALIVADLIRGHHNDRTEAQLNFDTRIHGWERDDFIDLRVLNRLTYQFGEHQVLLTGQEMAKLLRFAGFSNLNIITPKETVHFPIVPGNHYKRYPDSELEAFVVEGVRADHARGN